MTRRPEDTDPLPAPAKASDERADIRPGYTPEVFKSKGAQSNGEANAVYQGKAHAPHAGVDTQELQPAVVIDQTRKEGFSGSEIRAIVKELEVERQREKKTVLVEAAPTIPRQRTGMIVLVIGILLVLLIGFVIFKSQSNPTQDIPSASAAVASSSAPTSDSSQHDVTPTTTASAVSTNPIPTSTAQSSSTAPTASAIPTQSHLTATHPTASASAPSHPDSSASAHHAGDVPSGAL